MKGRRITRKVVPMECGCTVMPEGSVWAREVANAGTVRWVCVFGPLKGKK